MRSACQFDDSPARLAALAIAAILLAVPTGCSQSAGPPRRVQGSGGRAVPAGQGTILPGRTETETQKQEFIRAIRLRLYTIEVPIGLASATEEIWSYLDEEAVGARTHVALGLNGMRVGLGRGQDWPELAGILQKLTGRKIRDGATHLLPGNTTSISMKRDVPVQPLFFYRPDRTLTGQVYPDGEFLLSVSCGLNPEDTSQLLFTAMPHLRTVIDRPRYINRNGAVSVIRGPQFIEFRDLLFQLSVPSESYVVIGPGRESRRKTSMGHCLLVHYRKGIPFETVLVIVPEAFSAPRIRTRMGS
ncbi:MAG: hypothetical protein ACLFUJ_02825 [Phycisphaerae bacterium]